MTTAWTRSRAPSLVRTRLTWVFTVFSEMNSVSASSSLDSPLAMATSTSRSRSVRSAKRGLAVLAGRLENRSMSRRVTDGDSSPSPAAMVRIPSISCSGGLRLSRNPDAPAWRALNTYSSSSKVVRMRTLGGSGAMVIWRVASLPSAASPTTVRSEACWTIRRSPARISWSSSTRRTSITGAPPGDLPGPTAAPLRGSPDPSRPTAAPLRPDPSGRTPPGSPLLPGQLGGDHEPALAVAVDADPPAVHGRPLVHPEDAPAGLERRRVAAAVVGDPEADAAAGHVDLDAGRPGAGVLHGIGQGLLDDAVGGQPDTGRDLAGVPGDLDVDLEAGVGEGPGQLAKVADPRGRQQLPAGLVAAEHGQDPVELGQGGPAGPLDGLERLADDAAVVVDGLAAGAGVDDHHVDRVPDDVVELVGDPAPLLLKGQALLVGLGQSPGQVALGPQLDLLQAGAVHPPDQPRHHPHGHHRRGQRRAAFGGEPHEVEDDPADQGGQRHPGLPAGPVGGDRVGDDQVGPLVDVAGVADGGHGHHGGAVDPEGGHRPGAAPGQGRGGDQGQHRGHHPHPDGVVVAEGEDPDLDLGHARERGRQQQVGRPLEAPRRRSGHRQGSPSGQATVIDGDCSSWAPSRPRPMRRNPAAIPTREATSPALQMVGSRGALPVIVWAEANTSTAAYDQTTRRTARRRVASARWPRRASTAARMNSWMPWRATAWGNLATPRSPWRTVSGTALWVSTKSLPSSTIHWPNPSPITIRTRPPMTARRASRSRGGRASDQTSTVTRHSDMTATMAAMATKTAASPAARVLKCDARPRQACMVMSPTSMVEETSRVQAIVPASRGRSGSRSSTQPMVASSRAIDTEKVNGLRNETAPDQAQPLAARTTRWTSPEASQAAAPA